LSGDTEREKMLAGELYLASDPELTAMRLRTRRLLATYNSTDESESVRRLALLQELFGAIGPGAEIEPPFHCDYGGNIHAGSGLYMNVGCVVLDIMEVRLGDNVLCGPYVQILGATHPTDPALRLGGREMGAPITIGNNVWIGGGAIICGGVTIGDDTTIGAGSVIVRDVPAGVVAAGNPCRVIRRLR
jgi:maltose O-acetyltransferase